MEEFEYYIDSKKVSEEEIDNELEYNAEWYMADTGMFDEMQSGQMPESEYETILDNYIGKLRKELDDNGVLMGIHKVEKVRVYKY